MKKIISVFLCIILVFSCFTIVSFADSSDNTPVIVISGMNAYPLVDENEKTVFPMSADVLLKDVPPIAGSAVASLLSSNWKYLQKYGLDPISDLFAGMACDENGDSVKNIHVRTFPESLDNYRDEFESFTTDQQGAARAVADKNGWENTYFMYYDWRISPMKLADELAEYVDRALDEHNCDKVSLLPMSFGGTIVNSYLIKYGNEKIKNIVYASTAFNGVEMVGKLFSGDPKITLGDTMIFMAAFSQDIDVLTDILSFIAANEAKRDTIAEKYIDRTVQSLVDELGDEVYEKVFGSSFAHMKGIWCLMPDEYYETAKAFMKAHSTFSDTFFDEIDEYMDFQSSLKETLLSLRESGTNVYITGTYGFSGIPVTSGADKRTDTLIETYLMTGDTTVSLYGKTLDETDYTPVDCSGHNHISTDKCIDASSGMLPDQTWFVKGIGHLKYQYGTRSMDLLVWLVMSDELVSVYTDENYPQFFSINKKTGVSSSLTEGVSFDDEAQGGKWYDFIFKAFRSLIEIVMKIFKLEKLS